MNPAHFDYETLADLAEGLLEDDMAASVSEHLDTCDQCRERSADLADVSRILAEAPVPSMPAELASRIDSAIAAESLNTATVASLERRRGRRHWRIMSAAAATVIVLGGGGVIGTMVLSGSNEHQGGSANSPISDNHDRGTSGESSNQKKSTSTLVAPEGQASARTAFKVSQSGTDYRATTLATQVNGMVEGRAGTGADADRAPDPALAACVGAVTGGRTPTLVDTAKYEGAPATVIAAPGSASRTLDIWVVGPGCTAQDTKIIKHLSTALRD
ncbi:anti-sigma factor family protein [Spirillospora sp. CA-255316]